MRVSLFSLVLSFDFFPRKKETKESTDKRIKITQQNYYCVAKYHK